MYRKYKGTNKVEGTIYIQENPCGTEEKTRMRTGDIMLSLKSQVKELVFLRQKVTIGHLSWE